jgi:hypothetical protein
MPNSPLITGFSVLRHETWRAGETNALANVTLKNVMANIL